MKKLPFLLLTFSTIVAYGQTKDYTIKGVADTSYNSKTAYLNDYSTNKTIDSCVIKDAKFSFIGSAKNAIVLRVDLSRMYANVIPEAGTINVKMGESSEVSGTPLNDRLTAYNKERAEIYNYMSAQADTLMQRNALSSSASDSLYEIYTIKSSQIIDKYFTPNKTNKLGTFVALEKFNETSLSLAEMDSILLMLSAEGREFTPLKNIRQGEINRLQTAAGKMFIDFASVNPDGTPAKLSDYVGKGKYVLADFWASWCGPCRREIPNIKKANEQYKALGLVVLGVNVWDKKDAFEKAVGELGMTWAQICNFADSAPTKTYGIQGIPHIILFAPDGTIVARDLRGEGIDEKLSEIFKK
ncbi:MAG: TlpA disulfide reductase family protein [Mucinivorans sp.]